MNYNLKKSFTLIELLVVIAIIGLLSSIVFVNVNSARERAKKAVSRDKVRQLQIAVEMLVSDTGKWPFGCKIGEEDNLALMLRCRQSGLSGERPIEGGPSAYSCTLYPGDPGCCSFGESTDCAWPDEPGEIEVKKWAGPYVVGPYAPQNIRQPRDPWGKVYWFDGDYDLDEYCDNIASCAPEEIFCEDCPQLCSLPHDDIVVAIYSEGQNEASYDCDDVLIILDPNPN